MNKNKISLGIAVTFLVLLLSMMFSTHASLNSITDKVIELSEETEHLEQALQDINKELQSITNRLANIETSLEEYNSRITRLENLHMK